jgi:hypothetical protein
MIAVINNNNDDDNIVKRVPFARRSRPVSSLPRRFGGVKQLERVGVDQVRFGSRACSLVRLELGACSLFLGESKDRPKCRSRARRSQSAGFVRVVVSFASSQLPFSLVSGPPVRSAGKNIIE